MKSRLLAGLVATTVLVGAPGLAPSAAAQSTVRSESRSYIVPVVIGAAVGATIGALVWPVMMPAAAAGPAMAGPAAAAGPAMAGWGMGAFVTTRAAVGAVIGGVAGYLFAR